MCIYIEKGGLFQQRKGTEDRRKGDKKRNWKENMIHIYENAIIETHYFVSYLKKINIKGVIYGVFKGSLLLSL